MDAVDGPRGGEGGRRGAPHSEVEMKQHEVFVAAALSDGSEDNEAGGGAGGGHRGVAGRRASGGGGRGGEAAATPRAVPAGRGRPASRRG